MFTICVTVADGMTIKLFHHGPEHGHEATTLELNSILTFGIVRECEMKKEDLKFKVHFWGSLPNKVIKY